MADDNQLLSPALLPDETTEAITTLIREAYEKKSDKQTTMFQPIMYRKQTLLGGGPIYYIKVMVDDPKCVHLTVKNNQVRGVPVDPNPDTFSFTLLSIKENESLDSPLEPN